MKSKIKKLLKKMKVDGMEFDLLLVESKTNIHFVKSVTEIEAKYSKVIAEPHAIGTHKNGVIVIEIENDSINNRPVYDRLQIPHIIIKDSTSLIDSIINLFR